MLLDINGFENLSLFEKQHHINENGTFVGNRRYYNHNINLYSLYGFFVEVHYLPQENKIDFIEVIESRKVIKLYSDRINIKFL